MSGQRQQGGRTLAGFWRRALGALIDGLLIAVVLVAAEVGYLSATGGWTIDIDDPAQPIVAGTVLLVAVLYDVLLTWRLGGTLGKRLLKMRVAPRDGSKLGLGAVIARLLGRAVSLAPALLGFIWAAWDSRKQTWHDKLADTVVVRDDAPQARPVMITDEEGRPLASAAPNPMPSDSDEVHDTGPIAPVANAGSATPPPSAPPNAAPSQPPGQQPGPPPWQPAQQAAPVQPAYPPPAQQPVQPYQQYQPSYQPPAPGSPSGSAQPWGAPPSYAPTAPSGLGPPPGMPRNDPNSVAIGRAGLGHDAAVWLNQVAEQVDARLDRISVTWRNSPHAEAARACTFGLLVGHLARLYPHMRPELNATAELHPSFTTLLEGSRLATLEQIVAEPGRMTAWLGPLIDVHDPERMRALLD